MHLKRNLLLGGLTLVAVAAALGIWIVLFDTFFGLEGEIFGTIGSVALFSVPLLVASVLRERGHWTVAMITASAIGLLGLLYYLGAIWGFFEAFGARWWQTDLFWQLMAILPVWTWAIPWAGALAYVDLPARVRWVQRLAVPTTLLAALSITGGVFFERHFDDVAWKLVGTMSILTLLGTIAVPVLYKITGIEKVAATESTPLQLTLTCPRCLLAQTVPHGHSRCRQCRLKFEVRIEEPRCPSCNYLLHQLTTPVCPECGKQLSDAELPQPAEATGAQNRRLA